jgi:peptide chain release factor 2
MEMGEPGFWDDQEKAKLRVTALKAARGVVEALDGLAREVEDLQVLHELAVEAADDAGEAELRGSLALAQARYDELELKTRLAGPYDAGPALLTIQAGAGGTDASDWAQMLLRLYTRWAERAGYEVDLLDVSDHEEAGIKHATLRVTGPYAFGYLSGETGVHRLVRISPFDAQGRRQTSFAAIDVLPDLPADVDLTLDDKDLRVDTFRAGGKGGQHVNKTESAVRITHVPTGIVAQCQSERSQHKNREMALKMLKAKLIQKREAERNQELQSLYDTKGQIAWGNQIRSYVLAPYTMVKDHRTSHEMGNVQAVLDGEIDGFIEATLKQKKVSA